MITQSSQKQEDMQHRNPLVAVASRAADVAGDFVELVELQVKLAKFDAKSVVQKSGPAIVVALFSAILALSAFTVLLDALSSALAEVAGLKIWASQLIVCTITLVLVSVFIMYSMRKLKSSIECFNSSMTQLSENVAWIKSVVRGR